MLTGLPQPGNDTANEYFVIPAEEMANHVSEGHQQWLTTQDQNDRAALDWAIFHHIPHGGWWPKGRKAEVVKVPSSLGTQEL